MKNINGWSHVEYGGANYGSSSGNWPNQYQNLYATLDVLVLRNGAKGLFYVNDCDKESTEFVAKSLRKYAISKQLHEIIVKTLVGDYQVMELESTDFAHLKHPESHLFLGYTDLADIFQRMANHSKNGLEVTLPSEWFLKMRNLRNSGLVVIETPGGLAYTVKGKTEPIDTVNNRFKILSQK